MHQEIKPSQSHALLESFRSDYPAEVSLALSAVQGETSIILKQADGKRTAIAASALTKLPLATDSIERIECVMVAHRMPDAYRMLLECHRVVCSGGYILLLDYELPEEQRAARYVDALFRLRDSHYVQSYPAYGWQGTLLDAGFVLDTAETSYEKLRLIPPGSVPAQIRTHLQVMMTQVPSAAGKWLEPVFTGTDYAAFTARIIALTAHKEG